MIMGMCCRTSRAGGHPSPTCFGVPFSGSPWSVFQIATLMYQKIDIYLLSSCIALDRAWEGNESDFTDPLPFLPHHEACGKGTIEYAHICRV